MIYHDSSLTTLKLALSKLSEQLEADPFVSFGTFGEGARQTQVILTSRFYRLAKRGRIWGSPEMLTALKNAAYGLDASRPRSVGGRDGIFLLDRTYENEMTRKVFGRFLDRATEAAEVATYLGGPVEQLRAVRLVSHHLRLLGVLLVGEHEDQLVLVDYDDTGK